MKKTLLFIILLYCSGSIQAQSVISLEEASALDNAQQDYPDDLTYVKDINNRLDSFVGIWKGSNNGRLYEINFIKKQNWNFGINTPGINWDVLIGRILVKDSISNNIIFTTLNISDDSKTFFRGDNFGNPRVYHMSFYGPENGCYDYGEVYIVLFINDPAKMTLSYYRGGDLIDPRTCPGGYANYRTVLPAKLFLQKQ